MREEELKNMIETIPTEKWQYISGTRDIGKSYFQNLLDEKDKEIERLNNIINELKKYIEENWNAIEKEPDNSFYDGYDTCIEEMKKDILDKLQKLKGSDKE